MSWIKTISRSPQYGRRGLVLVATLGVLAPGVLSAKPPPPRPTQINRNGRNVSFPRNLLEQLSDDERARLQRLQQEDPKAFREEIKKIVLQRQRETSEERKKLRDLVRRAKAAEGDEKDKLVQELKKLVAEIFDRRMKDNWKNYKSAAKRLQELEATLKKRERHREEIVEGKVESLLKDPALKW